MAKKTESKGNEGESIQGYFKRILRENPKLLKGRSNQELLDRWKADHPGRDLTNSVKAGLQNAKSALRSKKRRRRKAPLGDGQPPASDLTDRAARPAKPPHGLERLEEQIDDCLALAKHTDRAGLESVIRLLHRARNEVVWKMGQ
jgi:hypothetical protein